MSFKTDLRAGLDRRLVLRTLRLETGTTSTECVVSPTAGLSVSVTADHSTGSEQVMIQYYRLSNLVEKIVTTVYGSTLLSGVVGVWVDMCVKRDHYSSWHA